MIVLLDFELVDPLNSAILLSFAQEEFGLLPAFFPVMCISVFVYSMSAHKEKREKKEREAEIVALHRAGVHWNSVYLVLDRLLFCIMETNQASHQNADRYGGSQWTIVINRRPRHHTTMIRSTQTGLTG